MKQTPIDPSKIRGKWQPPQENTDITADPIDNPPERTYKQDLPKASAQFKSPEKDTRPINVQAAWLAIVLLVGAFVIPSAIPISGFNYILQIVLALGSLVFNLQNPHLQVKKFPVLGFNPHHLLMIIACIAIILGANNLIHHITGLYLLPF